MVSSSKQHQVYSTSSNNNNNNNTSSSIASTSNSNHHHHHRGFASGSSSRQQARLGVTTDYLDLSLHSACANGNVGLVKYALQHGQPVNSVLNGVLPLHAAASSGNEQIVRMLIEAGADVNSPRLPRRYSNEKTRSSGLAVGTAGSTPLHFAAANGHTPVIHLLLRFGAKATAAEKYGLTPEVIAQQKGHLEAAELLREWSVDEEIEEAASIKEGKESSTSLRSSLSKKRIHPRRSFDALAVKLQQHASNPHLLAQHLPNAMSSGSLHALTDKNSTNLSRRLSVPGHVKEGESKRRPSLPSVFEKAAHPSSAIRQALGMTSLKRGSGDPSSSRSLRKTSSKSSLSSIAVWGKDPKRDLDEEDEDLYDSDLEQDEIDQGEDSPVRRKSEEFSRRGSKRDSLGSLASVREVPVTAPATKTVFAPSEYVPPHPPPLSRSGSMSTASAASFYRPRQSSQLSGRATSSAAPSPSNHPQVFIDDDEIDDEHQDSTPRNAHEVSTSAQTLQAKPIGGGGTTSTLRSPMHRREGSAASSSQASVSNASRIPSGVATPESMLTASRPTSDDGGSNSASGRSRSRADTRPPASVGSRATTIEPARRGAGFVVRDRTDSGASSAASSLSRRRLSNRMAGMTIVDSTRTGATTPPVVSSSEPSVSKKVETRTSRSNSAGTDGRFSSSPASSYSGPGTLSTYAPSTNSTTATSVATSKSSHRASPTPAHHARLPGLSPLYESSSSLPSGPPGVTHKPRSTHRSQLSSGSTITTSAEARSRVKKVEQELLDFDATGSSSGASGGASTLKNGAQGTTSLGSATTSLQEKLAAYGQGLALERKLKAIENNGYRIETIGTSSTGKPISGTTSSASSGTNIDASSAQPSPVHSSLPQWRAIPPVDRLMPPSQVAASGRRSVSPVSGLSHPSHSANPTRKGSREIDMGAAGITVVPIAASVNSSSNPSTGNPTRASSPSSSRSAKSQTHTLRAGNSSNTHHHHHHHHHRSVGSGGIITGSSASTSAAIPISIPHQEKLLGIGEKGISYVEASPVPSSSPSHHRIAPSSASMMAKQQNETGTNNGGGGSGQRSSSQKGSGSVTSTQSQIEADAMEQARLASNVPIAPITIPKTKGGFARRLFGK